MLETNLLKQHKGTWKQLTWEVFMLDTLLMSSKAWKDFKREWSVYNKLITNNTVTF